MSDFEPASPKPPSLSRQFQSLGLQEKRNKSSSTSGSPAPTAPTSPTSTASTSTSPSTINNLNSNNNAVTSTSSPTSPMQETSKLRTPSTSTTTSSSTSSTINSNSNNNVATNDNNNNTDNSALLHLFNAIETKDELIKQLTLQLEKKSKRVVENKESEQIKEELQRQEMQQIINQKMEVDPKPALSDQEVIEKMSENERYLYQKMEPESQKIQISNIRDRLVRENKYAEEKVQQEKKYEELKKLFTVSTATMTFDQIDGLIHSKSAALLSKFEDSVIEASETYDKESNAISLGNYTATKDEKKSFDSYAKKWKEFQLGKMLRHAQTYDDETSMAHFLRALVVLLADSFDSPKFVSWSEAKSLEEMLAKFMHATGPGDTVYRSEAPAVRSKNMGHCPEAAILSGHVFKKSKDMPQITDTNYYGIWLFFEAKSTKPLPSPSRKKQKTENGSPKSTNSSNPSKANHPLFREVMMDCASSVVSMKKGCTSLGFSDVAAIKLAIKNSECAFLILTQDKHLTLGTIKVVADNTDPQSPKYRFQFQFHDKFEWQNAKTFYDFIPLRNAMWSLLDKLASAKPIDFNFKERPEISSIVHMKDEENVFIDYEWTNLICSNRKYSIYHLGRGYVVKQSKSNQLEFLLKKEAEFLSRIAKEKCQFIPKFVCFGKNLISNKVLVMNGFGEKNLWNYKLEESEIEFILKAVESALNVIHNVGFVYADLHPGNIVYSRNEGKCYLIDFESVVPINKAYGSTPLHPAFCSPHCFPFSNVALIENDFHSLAFVSYYLKNGNLPFDDLVDEDDDIPPEELQQAKIEFLKEHANFDTVMTDDPNAERPISPTSGSDNSGSQKVLSSEKRSDRRQV